MQDYFSKAYNDAAITGGNAPTSKGAAFTFATFAVGEAPKQLCLDNGFNVDCAVVIAYKYSSGTVTQKATPIYLRAGAVKTLDLEANGVGQRAPGGQVLLQFYYPGGSAPTDGSAAGYPNTFVADCLFSSPTL